MAIGADDLPTRIVAARWPTIAEGAKLLRDGRLVAFQPKLSMASAPTRSTNMPWRHFRGQGSPRFNPLIVHVRDARRPMNVSNSIRGLAWQKRSGPAV